ncbi:hypothetical protein PsorP6_014614 [Peronosclerospora sorghi]|uniref:Uncharacterized protein n=1 Tax=Peronosclerospora sorghi TaxID=230839 RepID=A0ACC0VRT6_9STRA|nr:hypothetical protein PsorP6_014614 [Peronosclerospora sorghi]
MTAGQDSIHCVFEIPGGFVHPNSLVEVVASHVAEEEASSGGGAFLHPSYYPCSATTSGDDVPSQFAKVTALTTSCFFQHQLLWKFEN